MFVELGVAAAVVVETLDVAEVLTVAGWAYTDTAEVVATSKAESLLLKSIMNEERMCTCIE